MNIMMVSVTERTREIGLAHVAGRAWILDSTSVPDGIDGLVRRRRVSSACCSALSVRSSCHCSQNGRPRYRLLGCFSRSDSRRSSASSSDTIRQEKRRISIQSTRFASNNRLNRAFHYAWLLPLRGRLSTRPEEGVDVRSAVLLSVDPGRGCALCFCRSMRLSARRCRSVFPSVSPRRRLPQYYQPDATQPNMIWQPGYWGFGSDGFFWVPGTWVQAPQVGLFGRPAIGAGTMVDTVGIAGYWGRNVGYYGGINYGYGYYGSGLSRWTMERQFVPIQHIGDATLIARLGRVMTITAIRVPT